MRDETKTRNTNYQDNVSAEGIAKRPGTRQLNGIAVASGGHG
jgi:hypothetical protein